jgi:sporadic carbohydrate cluster 2OG-Fe(II) oxygenase
MNTKTFSPQFDLTINAMNFVDEEERTLGERFVRQGYVIHKIESIKILEQIQNYIYYQTCDFLQIPNHDYDRIEFLNLIHTRLGVEKLNSLRLFIIKKLFCQDWFRPYYFHLAKKILQQLVGSELVMQRSLGLSVQFPGDESSLLNIHADSWSGDSPYEAVVWLPLVNCYKTKSMYILSPQRAKAVCRDFDRYALMSNLDFFDAIKEDVTFININYGEVLIFNQNLPHGNIVNEENETRWSLNCRFKSLFSPYADKKLGEFFLPITTAPMTTVGMDFQYPKVKIES